MKHFATTTAAIVAIASMAAIVAPPAATPAAAAVQDDTGWEVGPVIRGRSYSPGLPRWLDDGRAGPFFDFPVGNDARAGHVHYVTRRIAPQPDARTLTLRYRIDAAPGTRFVAQQRPDLPATISLYFQRHGDDWRAGARTQFYRWYAPSATMHELRPGTHVMRVALADDGWVPVLGGPSPAHRDARADAWADASRIGVVFGSSDGRGHGVYATAPARFTLLDFSID